MTTCVVKVYPAARYRADYHLAIEAQKFASITDALDGADDLLDEVRYLESEGTWRGSRFEPAPREDYRVRFVIDGEEMDRDQAEAVARTALRPVERVDLEQIARAVLGVRS